MQNTPNTSQLDLGRVSSVATNQACVDVEQIIVPYLGMILLNCFSNMFKIVQSGPFLSGTRCRILDKKAVLCALYK